MMNEFKKIDSDDIIFKELTVLENKKKYLKSLINNSKTNISSSKKTSAAKRKRSEEMGIKTKNSSIEEDKVKENLQSIINEINSYKELIESLKLKNEILKNKLGINSQILHDLNDYLIDVIYNDKNDVDKETMKQDILEVLYIYIYYSQLKKRLKMLKQN